MADDGRGLAGIGVYLSASGADRTRSVSRQTTTNEDGHFEFTNLADRNYFVSATSQKGYVMKPPAQGEPGRGRLRPGDSVTITMLRGGVITGRVTNSNGEPLVSDFDLAKLLDADDDPAASDRPIPLDETLTDAATDFLVKHGYDEAYGARPLKRAIQKYIEDPLSEKILMGEFSRGDEIEVEVTPDGSKLGFRVLTSTTKA